MKKKEKNKGWRENPFVFSFLVIDRKSLTRSFCAYVLMCVCKLCRGWQTAKANMSKRMNNYRGGDEMPSVKWMVLSVSGGFSQFRKLKKIGTFCCWLSMRNRYFTNWHMQHIDDLISCFHSLCLPSIQMVSLFRPLSLSRFPSVSIRLCMNPSIFPISFCMPTTFPVVLNHLNKRDYSVDYIFKPCCSDVWLCVWMQPGRIEREGKYMMKTTIDWVLNPISLIMIDWFCGPLLFF